MQKVLGAVSSGSCITRSPANSGRDTSLAPGFLGPALRFTSPKLLRKKIFHRTWVLCTQKAFCHELSHQTAPIKPTGSIVKVRPRHLVIPRAPSSPIRSSPLFHITNRASNGCDVKHCCAQNSSTMFVNG